MLARLATSDLAQPSRVRGGVPFAFLGVLLVVTTCPALFVALLVTAWARREALQARRTPGSSGTAGQVVAIRAFVACRATERIGDGASHARTCRETPDSLARGRARRAYRPRNPETRRRLLRR